VEHKPDIVIIDHTLTFDSQGHNNNELTDKLARTLENLKRRFPVHFIVLSHAGSDFRIPTEAEPIVNRKIVAWSGSLEQAADNIAGTFRTEGNRLNFFWTKVRWGTIPPMYYSYRVDHVHNLMTYVQKDQLLQSGASLDLEELNKVYADTGLFEDFGEDATSSADWEELD
jgi:hypothetical protein